MSISTALMTGTAFAQAGDAAAPKGPSLIETFAPFVFMIVVMYFLVMRPQTKKAREQAAMLESLKAGDEVVTTGGIIGKVRSVAETFVTVEVAQNTAIKVLKANVSLMTKTPAAAGAAEKVPAKT